MWRLILMMCFKVLLLEQGWANPVLPGSDSSRVLCPTGQKLLSPREGQHWVKVLATSRYKTRLESGPEGRDSPKIGVQKWIALRYRVRFGLQPKESKRRTLPTSPRTPQSWVGDQPPPVYPACPINKQTDRNQTQKLPHVLNMTAVALISQAWGWWCAPVSPSGEQQVNCVSQALITA